MPKEGIYTKYTFICLGWKKSMPHYFGKIARVRSTSTQQRFSLKPILSGKISNNDFLFFYLCYNKTNTKCIWYFIRLNTKYVVT